MIAALFVSCGTFKMFVSSSKCVMLGCSIDKLWNDVMYHGAIQKGSKLVTRLEHKRSDKSRTKIGP